MAKRTYYTKAELMDFAKFTHSDDRRFKLQIELRDKIKKGMINPMPASLAERIVTEEDFNEWKKSNLI
jgi:CRISPR/Cas system-associated endonuclease Cas1